MARPTGTGQRLILPEQLCRRAGKAPAPSREAGTSVPSGMVSAASPGHPTSCSLPGKGQQVWVGEEWA